MTWSTRVPIPRLTGGRPLGKPLKAFSRPHQRPPADCFVGLSRRSSLLLPQEGPRLRRPGASPPGVPRAATHFCYDVATHRGGLRGPEVAPVLRQLLRPDIPKESAQYLVRQLTYCVLEEALALYPKLNEASCLFLLRAGLPMSQAAIRVLTGSESIPIACSKDKDSTTVNVHFWGEPTRGRPVVILDTMIARGDSVRAVCDELRQRGQPDGTVSVICCYAAPEGMEAVAQHPSVHAVWTAARGASVDAQGYVQPPTFGDMGDKLFGPKAPQDVGGSPARRRAPTAWLSPSPPAHPLFRQTERIEQLARDLKAEVLTYAMEGTRQLLIESSPSLALSYAAHPNLWRAALQVHKYGVIYPMCRAEAGHALEAVASHQEQFAQIDARVRRDGFGDRVFNYALHRFAVAPTRTLRLASSLLSPGALASLDAVTFCGRPVDFIERSVDDALATPTALYDFHDMSHAVAASLCAPLYGSTYFEHLQPLPIELRQLVTSPGLRDATGPLASDGILFSELLTGLLPTAMPPPAQQGALVDRLAAQLLDYLLGRQALLHPSTGRMLRLADPITPRQLAVLAQNKSYELPASEVEQKVFTRGGADKRDVLDAMSGWERLEYLAQGPPWLYFEARNTLKHRAQKLAYLRLAQHLQAQGGSPDLCQAIRDNLTYRDHYQGRRQNLWQRVGQLGR
jgi:uracil phosphoribosyltransferase